MPSIDQLTEKDLLAEFLAAHGGPDFLDDSEATR